MDEVSLEALDKELRWYLTRSRTTYTKMPEMHKPVSDLIVDGTNKKNLFIYYLKSSAYLDMRFIAMRIMIY